MQTVAFLRGMNVGGHRITNDALREAFEALGFGGVGTYRASGNVFFTGPADSERIAMGLEQALGYAVPTLLRSGEEVQRLAGLSLFTTEELAASRGKVQVMLIDRAPSEALQGEILDTAPDEDRLVFDERALFWLPAAGLLDSDLDLKQLERLLGLVTTRTLGTLQGIAKKLG